MYRVNANENDPRGATYSAYIQAKHAKMKHELAEKQLTTLFSGKVFWLNGRLEPSISYLRSLIGIHGGQVVFEWDRSVNIMVVQSLSATNYMKYDGKLDIVTPDYVVLSTEKNELLDPKEFKLGAEEWEMKRDAIQANVIFPPFEVATGGDFLDPPEIDQSTELFDVSDEVVFTAEWSKRLDEEQKTTEDEEAAIVQASPIIQPQLPSQTTKEPEKFKLHEYHAFSRLHYLSRWRLDSQEYLILNPPYGPATLTNQRPYYCHVDIDYFFVEALIVGEQDRYASIPLAVCSCQGGDESTADICSCNYAARAFGVKNGMFLREAKTRCPNIVVMEYDFEIYEELSRQFYESLRDLTSDIHPVSCDEAYLRLTGIVDAESCYPFMEKVKGRMKEKLGLTVTVGIGNSVLMARLATKLAKPDGAFYLQHEELMERIADCNIDLIPSIGPQLSGILASHHIITCRDCFDQSLSTLEELIGEVRGRELFNALRGNDIIFNFRSICKNELPKAISVSANYGVRATSIQDLRSAFDEVFTELLARLSSRDLCYSAFQCKVSITDKRSDEAYAKFKGMGHCTFSNYDVQLRVNESDLQALERLFQKVSARTNLKDFRGLEGFAKISGRGKREVVQKTETTTIKHPIRAWFEEHHRPLIRFFEVVDMQNLSFDELVEALQSVSEEACLPLVRMFVLEYCRRGNFDCALRLVFAFKATEAIPYLRAKWKYLEWDN